MNKQTHKGSIYVEDARLISRLSYSGEQYILRLAAPQIAQTARPGNFVHLQCHRDLPLRRPFSIMRTNTQQGWIEILYKVVGHGTERLALYQQGELINIMGPIGNAFELAMDKTYLLIGGGVGIPPMVCCAEELRQMNNTQHHLVIMGSEIPFPFASEPSDSSLPGIADTINQSMPLLNQWGINNRLSSQQNYTGCFSGFVTDLARLWLDKLDNTIKQRLIILACGPTPMLQAVAQLARAYELPCQVSLEEYMACAVGGCAGCTVLVNEKNGPAMKKVCVDGPVFDAHLVYPVILIP